ncbi:MAG: hypothetical protein ACO1SV_14765 [Fimbriimonas sp.]
MKTRKKRMIALGVGALAALALAGAWWSARPSGPTVAPEIAAQLRPESRVPLNGLGGPPPPGTRWEVYSISMPYPQALAAMKRQPDWRLEEGKDPIGLATASFTPLEPGTIGKIGIKPGRVLVIDPKVYDSALIRSGGFSVVTVAVPIDGSLGRSLMAFVGRMFGRNPAPTASRKIVVYHPDYAHVVRTPVTPVRAKPPR